MIPNLLCSEENFCVFFSLLVDLVRYSQRTIGKRVFCRAPLLFFIKSEQNVFTLNEFQFGNHFCFARSLSWSLCLSPPPYVLDWHAISNAVDYLYKLSPQLRQYSNWFRNEIVQLNFTWWLFCQPTIDIDRAWMMGEFRNETIYVYIFNRIFEIYSCKSDFWYYQATISTGCEWWTFCKKASSGCGEWTLSAHVNFHVYLISFSNSKSKNRQKKTIRRKHTNVFRVYFVELPETENFSNDFSTSRCDFFPLA